MELIKNNQKRPKEEKKLFISASNYVIILLSDIDFGTEDSVVNNAKALLPYVICDEKETIPEDSECVMTASGFLRAVKIKLKKEVDDAKFFQYIKETISNVFYEEKDDSNMTLKVTVSGREDYYILMSFARSNAFFTWSHEPGDFYLIFEVSVASAKAFKKIKFSKPVDIISTRYRNLK